MLLAADSALPSAAGLVARAPLRGSWWAHPDAHAIFRVGKKLSSHPDVLQVRLFSGKLTFVHRRLWGELISLASALETWQTEGLSEHCRALLSSVERNGQVRTDKLAARLRVSEKALGVAARELEDRLLVYGESLHTASGAHTKLLESWGHVIKRLKFRRARAVPGKAKETFEKIAGRLELDYGRRVRLPWKRGKAASEEIS